VIVQGSRAAGTARPTSDIDFAIRLSPEEFDAFVRAKFGRPNPGSAKERTMQTAIQNGRVHAGEAGLRKVREQLKKLLGIEVDIAVIRRGGPFDQGPSIPVPRM
jgi:predicted nucleotidyltransferase